ncbi:DUF3939 domain-containing protein [Aquibacillus rhizosphaerae]|uniref:DUF3939 domain-containing protein n=1 Tax=Aquibacillus rhizosphaerae TaxID=3051431 RepID=A0ABT7LA85_9BACI|nr:DUF3939 domain-containing protein [Aquibacillus sp. LR5S19]MDL4842787.1 DUF3939 domain-containing protein [Aquibacillus sp. LR5S19]
MWEKFKRKAPIKPKQKKDYPFINISLPEIKRAIQKYSLELPDDIPLSVIINDDLSIDYHLLAPILKGIPKEKYFMSRETYEIYEEQDYKLALEIDMVQKAVDNYMKQTDDLPVIHGDPYKKVSFHKLEKLDLIDYRPAYDFYVTNEEYLITNEKPN